MREVEMTVSAASITSDASGQPTRRSDISTSPLGMFLHGHRNFEQRDAGSNIPEIKPVRVDGDPVRERRSCQVPCETFASLALTRARVHRTA